MDKHYAVPANNLMALSYISGKHALRANYFALVLRFHLILKFRIVTTLLSELSVGKRLASPAAFKFKCIATILLSGPSSGN